MGPNRFGKEMARPGPAFPYPDGMIPPRYPDNEMDRLKECSRSVFLPGLVVRACDSDPLGGQSLATMLLGGARLSQINSYDVHVLRDVTHVSRRR